jgi:hypothetical protein
MGSKIGNGFELIRPTRYLCVNYPSQARSPLGLDKAERETWIERNGVLSQVQENPKVIGSRLIKIERGCLSLAQSLKKVGFLLHGRRRKVRQAI